MIEIRDAKESDFELICNFFNDKKELQFSFPHAIFPVDIDQLKKIVSTRSNPTILTSDNIVIGFTDLYNIVENEECFIGNFIIDKNYRKKGFSNILLQEIINRAIALYNIKKIKLICFCENTNALLLYKKFSFNPVELAIREFDTIKVPVLLLEKIIR